LSLEEEKTTRKLSEIVKIGGYLVAGGALVGFSAGLYLLFNRPLLSFFIHIGQFEVMSYIIGVFVPSFVILIVVGYFFATTLGLRSANLSDVVPLCVLSLLCMVLSALSVFYFLSFLGGALTLAASIIAYTKPAFRALAKREAFCLVEIGAMLVASFSLLFLSMWLLSNLFPSYAMGFYRGYSPYALLLVGILSILTFFAIPLIGSRGTNAGMCGALGLIMTILSYLFVVQNRYSFFDAPAYVGILMMVLGFVLALVGDLVYVKLFFSETAEPTIVPVPSLLSLGKYCPYCGNPRVTASQNLCSHCGKSLMWTPYAAFCSSCGRIVPANAQNCPHCQEDIGNKRIFFYSQVAEERKIADKLVKESRKQKSWTMKGLMKMAGMLQTVGQAFSSVTRFFNAVLERLSLTLKEVVFIMILTYLLGFLSFIVYVKVVPSKVYSADIIILGYGFPLEWLQVKSTLRGYYAYDVGVLWISFAFDVMLYFLASFALVYGIARLRR